MRLPLISFALMAVSLTPVFADDKADALKPIHQFIDGMNANNMKYAAGAYAPRASIIDEFPPHHWQGPTAFADWGRDYAIDAKKHGDTDPHVSLAEPKRVDINGDRAYVVMPAAYSYKENGKPVNEIDSTMTVALQKIGADWRIVGWAWSSH